MLAYHVLLFIFTKNINILHTCGITVRQGHLNKCHTFLPFYEKACFVQNGVSQDYWYSQI